MDAIMHKLDEFTKAATGDALEYARARVEGVKADRWRQLNQAKGEIFAEVAACKRRRLQEIHAREGLRISGHLLQSRNMLFSYRQNAAKTVKALVTEEIRQFTEQKAYPLHLKALLARALALFDQNTAVTILLRPADISLRDSLEQGVRGPTCTFRPGAFHLGGLVVISASQAMRVDLTFDTALEGAMYHFAELFGMDLT